jgi:O-acetyl-ADP-ribose deacetylase (regulator of RNase III)
LKLSKAKLIAGYDLLARHVIHAVGPIWSGGEQDELNLLASCYRESLGLAHRHQLKSIAFPAISCGIYRFPAALAAEIALSTIAEWMQRPTTIEKIYLVCFGDEILSAYKQQNQLLRSKQ